MTKNIDVIIRVSRAHQYHYALRDWEIKEFGGGIRDLGEDHEGNSRHGVPMVFPCTDFNQKHGDYQTVLGEAWQFFTFDLLSMVYFGKTHEFLNLSEYGWLADRWKGLYDGSTAFTNGSGTDTRRNYITRKLDDMNMAAKQGIGIYSLVCGGASLRGIGVPSMNVRGVKMIAVDYFDGTKPPPNIHEIDIQYDPRIFFATTITDKKLEYGYMVRPFVYLENPVTHEVNDVPIPLISTAPLYYPFDDLDLYTAVDKKSPYNPPR